MSGSTLSLITVPFVMGVIGYLTNWTGVLMLFYPVHFKGLRAPWIRRVARVLPYRVRQIPGIMIGERMRDMAPQDFAEMLRTATREDELLLLHGAVLGLAGGLAHLGIFG